MDCCDWLWFIESLDDFDGGVPVQPMPPLRVDDLKRQVDGFAQRLRIGLRTLLCRSLSLFGANRRVIVARDTPPGMAYRSSSHDKPPQTEAA